MFCVIMVSGNKLQHSMVLVGPCDVLHRPCTMTLVNFMELCNGYDGTEQLCFEQQAHFKLRGRVDNAFPRKWREWVETEALDRKKGLPLPLPPQLPGLSEA